MPDYKETSTAKQFFYLLLTAITIMIASFTLKSCLGSVEAKNIPPKLVIGLYDKDGHYITTKEIRNRVSFTFGGVQCTYAYKAKSRAYVMYCRQKASNKIIFTDTSSCRKLDKKLFKFTVSTKDEEGSRQYYFEWFCNPRQEA